MRRGDNWNTEGVVQITGMWYRSRVCDGQTVQELRVGDSPASPASPPNPPPAPERRSMMPPIPPTPARVIIARIGVNVDQG